MQQETVRKELSEAVYVNSVSLQMGVFDVVFDFGVWLPLLSGEQDASVVEPKVRLVMSHAHAKSMYDSLGEVLSSYEKEVGKIPVAIAPEKSSGAGRQEE